MKKKLSSLFTAVLVLLVCAFASACGNNYNKMEFEVLYAYSEQATEWFDGTNGISLNYNPNDELPEGEERSSLVFGDEGAKLYLKVKIKNVKAKHVGTMTLSPTSTQGLDFSSIAVKEDRVFSIDILGNVNTTLKIYENNSGKKHGVNMVVSRELESISADLTIKPAMNATVGSTLNLNSLNNLTYNPHGLTNQFGVTYSIKSIGYFSSTNYNPTKENETDIARYLTIDGNNLKVLDSSFFNDRSYVVKVVATSIYHDGSVDEDDVILTNFYVYLTESTLQTPVVKFNDINGKALSNTINVYENGGVSYSKSTIFVESAKISDESIYAVGQNTYNGIAIYETVIYVLNENGVYEKYDFESQDPDNKTQIGINGLYITKGVNENTFVVSISERNENNYKNLIKVAYEIAGLNFSQSEKIKASKEIVVQKGVLPTCITVNDTIDLQSGDEISDVVYSTSNSSYRGLELKLSANPNDNNAREIILSYDESKLSVTDKYGNRLDKVYNNSTIYVKFKSAAVETQNLTIKTLSIPDCYNEVKITQDDKNKPENYMAVTYKLTNLVTANKFEFVQSPNNQNPVAQTYVDAAKDDYIFAKVYYTGTNLDTETIKIKSDNSSMLFANGTNEMLLSDASLEKTETGANEKCDIYKILIKKTNSNITSNITISVSESLVGVRGSVRVSAVHLMNAKDGIKVKAKTTNIETIADADLEDNVQYFAISKGEFAEFEIVDGNNTAKTISKIQLQQPSDEEFAELPNGYFSNSALSYSVISNSTFVAIGRMENKTQILKLVAHFHYRDKDTGEIVDDSQQIEIQVAVYDSVASIITSITNRAVGFINPYYTEISSTTVDFNSYTSIHGTPTGVVRFYVNSELKEISGVSKIKIEVANATSIRDSEVQINLENGSQTYDLISGFNNVFSNLNGTLKIQLTKNLPLDEISLTIKALRFNKESNVVTNVTIPVLQVDKAQRIVVSGTDLISRGENNPPEIELSFIDVQDGGYDEKSINVDLQFGNQIENSLRFDDIETALTYVLYRYQTDEEGKIITDAYGKAITTRIQDAFFDVVFEDGKVKIKAYKNLGGGLFKLVLATKDSYNKTSKPTNVVEEDFNKTYPITLRVSDGELGSEYVIKTTEELNYINYNLDKHFVLGANLGDDEIVDIKPIGLIGNNVYKFTGSLSGKLNSLMANDKILDQNYSISLLINQNVVSLTDGDLYGLFATIGETGKVSNLNVNVAFKDEYSSDKINGLKVGAIAAVNEGAIENVAVSSYENVVNIKSAAGTVDFGVVVGLNKNDISSVKVNLDNELSIKLNSVTTHNIGLVAGTNAENAQIVGKYVGKESLNNFIFDVVSNLHVENINTSGKMPIRVGGVAGTNNGVVSGFLVGGQISMSTTNDREVQIGSIGGLVGLSTGTGNKVELSTALSLNINSTSNNIEIGGIVGNANETIINNVKFVSAITEFGSVDISGVVSGEALVGGIVAKATNGSIKYATVESFVDKIYDEATHDYITVNTLQDGSVTAGLVASVSGTNVENSFVSANIKSKGTIYLTTNATETNTYFIGLVDGTVSENKTTYSVINGEVFKGINKETVTLSSYFLPVVHEGTTSWTNIFVKDGENYVVATEFVTGIKYYYSTDLINYQEITSVNNETKDWTNIYFNNQNGTYTKVDAYDSTKDNYVQFKTDDWKTYAQTLATGSDWFVQADYNVAKLNGVEVFFPYIVRNWDHDNDAGTENKTEPLQIVEPKSISAEINQGYLTTINSVYIKEYNYAYYDSLVVESALVNYFNGAGDSANTHNILSTTTLSDFNPDGLLNTSILPEDAQGGYNFEILGDGYKYAYINSDKKIVFTGASGQTPILVRIYSMFNDEISVYVTFYTQCLFTNLTLNSNSLNFVNEADYKYEMNAYTGQSNKIISLNAENIDDQNNNRLTIFDVYGISQYLDIEASSNVNNSKLTINPASHESTTLKIRELNDGETIADNDYEIVTFTLFIKSEYFAGSLNVDKIKIGSVTLKVNLYNSAKSIDVDGSDMEITTSDDINFGVNLTTDFVNVEDYASSTSRVERDYVNSEGEIRFDVIDGDSIIIKLNVLEGDEKTLIKNVNKLIPNKNNHKQHFAELFDITITSQLYKSNVDKKVLGYKYNIALELKNQHEYRYINNNIKYEIVVIADSNRDVNNMHSPMEITLKPAVLSTARIENYKVTSLNVNTDYTSLVSNNDIQTSIVEPGSLGNVMMIYLEPTYSNVVSASIKTSSLYVPSLGKDVQLKFTQLAYDKRGGTNAFSTLTGEYATPQVGDTLTLKPISVIENDGTYVNNGVVFVYIQLERFIGLEATITVELNVETSNGLIVNRTKDLLTTYVPSIELKYDQNKGISDGYLIQKGTSNNEAKLKIYGYQFNSNPEITFAWNLIPEKDNKGNNLFNDINSNGKQDENEDFIYQGGFKYGAKKQIITDGTNNYLIGDYISYYLNKNYDEITYNSAEDSYELILTLNISEDIPAPFSLSAKLSLTTKDGQLHTSENNKLNFYPTEYILKSVGISDLTNSNRKNIAIGKTKELEFVFETDNAVNDMSDTIYEDLIEYAKTCSVASCNEFHHEKISGLFSYYKNGHIKFSDSILHTEFDVDFVNNNLTITGIEKFSNLISLQLNYHYEFVNGEYKVVFGEHDDDTKSLYFTFTLNIYAIDPESEVLVYSADDIYNSKTGTWDLAEGANYVLVNDIELEQVAPITTAIGSFDGNNRVISIKSFMVDPTTSDYGLFASIGTYEVEDPDNETTFMRQTILKNMIVDYGKFEGSLALNNNTTPTITFGGLVAQNKGGLIYNCDVMNLTTSDKEIDIIVSSSANLTFGGLVGENAGIITNSRVGRDGYTKIIATKTTESSTTLPSGGLSFNIFNQESEDNQVNSFSVVAGGFVGSNAGTVSSSYISKTNLLNYSTNESINITAGFVGNNTGTISYSYSKADDKTITTSNPYSTGYVIHNKGNGVVAGFVYNNSGTINNSYSNLELKTYSAYISGFVYNNTGTITESYAATKMNAGKVDSYAEQPFVGINSSGDLLSSGKMENTYYLMRTPSDNPYIDGDKDTAQAMNEENFQNEEHLIGFVFVLSNARSEREQGVWSYYTLEGKKRILPELMNANAIAHSYRYVVETEAEQKTLRETVSYSEGSSNNPYTISTVDQFNKVFTSNGTSDNFVGHVRFINNINFNDDEKAIQTRTNFTLGSSSSKTSVEGNGMMISGIYLDVGEAVVERIGLFAEINNAYIKNLNLNFATPTTDGQFSTTTAKYSGGLAGTIKDSAIININLKGQNTTLTGSNFVGGVAGLISGNSLVYGIETNLNIKTSSTENNLYYNENDYRALNIKATTHYEYADYLTHVSYAGGVAGVLDLTKRSNITYNVQFIDIRGDQMTAKTFDGAKEANILAQYAGGVAGYAGEKTNSFKLRYFTGKNETLRGDYAVGGLYGVAMGGITASQVTASEDVQFTYDTEFGKYVIDLSNSVQGAEFDTAKVGNLNLIEGYKFVGGLVGVGLNANINASYSKASIYSGEIVGGLLGLSVASTINYSYAVPFINSQTNMLKIGGLIGSAYGIDKVSPDRNSSIASYENLLKHKGVTDKDTDIQFTYSTVIMNNTNWNSLSNKVVIDYVVADYKGTNDTTYIGSNQTSTLLYVFAGTVNYSNNGENIVKNETKESNQSAIMELSKLYNVENPGQLVYFQEVFSGWSLIKYWTLNEDKYFPLLTNRAANNYIDIDEGDDFRLLEINPNGKFRVVKDIDIDASTCDNWVVSGLFQGVLIGQKEGDSTRPKITIRNLSPNTENETVGFFQETLTATISNLKFVWGSTNTNNGSINLSNVDKVSLVSGLLCKDTNSLISNVEVRVEETEHIIKETNKTIGGFGGLVGDSTNTNILGSVFAGKVKAKLGKSSKDNEIFVGGTIGVAQTKQSIEIDGKDEESKQSAVINNASVGVSGKDSSIEPTTSFDLTIADNAPVYIGGSIGKATNVAIASNKVGGTDYGIENGKDYSDIDITISFNSTSGNAHIGGIVGHAIDGMIFNCNALTNITASGSTTDKPTINIGGLAGYYHMASQATSSGISNSNALTNISTVTLNGDGNKLSILSTSDNTHVRLSTGVAQLSGYATMKQCLFTGEVNTEGSNISILYVGGASAYVNSDSVVELEEISTNSILYAGTSQTKQLYAGGLIGKAKNIEVTYSVSWGRIVPITTGDESSIIYVGGLIGEIETQAHVNNSYTTTSIIADSIADSAISKLKIGALVGKIPDNSTTDNINFINVFYSSDYALFADENYVKNTKNSETEPLGRNYSAQTLMFNTDWHADLQTEDGERNQIWTSFNMPYLTSAYESLINYGILEGSTNKYVSGSPMSPIQISDKKTFKDTDKYAYYLLLKDASVEGTLNGILIGQDDKFKTNLNISKVSKHSAVSNIHIELSNAISNNIVMVGENAGVIFNCSVGGTGISVSGSSAIGLIANTNNGMVSYCYSNVEIISSAATVGGIVGSNYGKLLSNYFTGYIEGATSAGIAYSFNNGYAYNNYVAGVIKNIFINGNAFHALGILSGSNNFIDSYSDLAYANKEYIKQGDKDVAHAMLKPVTTADLMSRGATTSHKLLSGEWYTTVQEGDFIRNVGADGSVKFENTFGLNYNYPIYKFNRYREELNELKINDWNYQLETGTGLIDETENFVTDKDEDGQDDNEGEFTLEERYSTLVNYKSNNSGVYNAYQNYTNAFKIPHLGVLTAINNLLDESRNYVVIYDLDGKYGENYANWEAVGGGSQINGFNSKMNSENEYVFHGVLIANKYHGYNYADTEKGIDYDEYFCTISNLTGSGLFATIDQAYLGDITIGNFNLDAGNGALGTSVSALDSENENTPPNVYVNNINFESNSKICANSSSVNFGGLFGVVNGFLQVGRFNNENNLMKFEGGNAVGLIAGVLSDGGKIELLENDESKYLISAKETKNVGGVVGEIAGGTILGNENTIIVNGEGSTIIGGVAAISTTADSTISDIKVNVASTIKTNIFGGIIGHISAPVEVSNFTISSSSSLKVVTTSGERYFGLLAGLQEANLIVKDSYNVESITSIEVSGSTTYDINTSNTGIGAYVGKKNSGDLNVVHSSMTLSISTLGIPNIGGFIGYLEGSGDIEFNYTGGSTFIVSGSTNVGGLVGYVNTVLTSDMFGSLLTSGTQFAQVAILAPTAENKHQNYGGLFGKWNGGNDGVEIKNSNALIIPKSEIVANPAVYNIGGVAGMLTTSDVSSLINLGEIKEDTELGGDIFSTEIIRSHKFGTDLNPERVIKLINVGGIAGSFAGTIKNAMNTQTIKGYQNVGGLVGYAETDSIIENSITYKTLGADAVIEEDKIAIKLQDGTYQQIDGTPLNNSGNIYGVINVGGAVGYLKGSTISGIFSSANVYGNANVGGLVGLSDSATLTNNHIKGTKTIIEKLDGTIEIQRTGAVKGVYYYSVALKKQNYTTEIIEKSFIPTSVGGLVGTASESTLNKNVVNGVQVISSEETHGGLDTISTISNYMASVAVGKNNNINNYATFTTNGKSNFDNENKINYSEIQSGYGGFVGTIDQDSMFMNYGSGEDITQNLLIDLEINAQLGINVGTHYGVYKNDSTSEKLILIPAISQSNPDKPIMVDGAYNVGGIVGFIYGGIGTALDGLNNTNDVLKNLQPTEIKLQENFTGMYVGGLVGKTNANTITNFNIANNGSVNILINTDNCYYAGGLIGRAEVDSDNATISGNLGDWTKEAGKDGIDGTEDDEWVVKHDDIISGTQDDRLNFGALIGMLKVGKSSKGLSVTVDGKHNYPFTINTIENSNYHDGDSRFNVDTQDGLLLEAEAYYVNKDTFNITGSSNKELYDNNEDTNPLNILAKGWSKEYTGFKQLQRNIPYDENNGAEWDSIAVLFDAGKITHVGTIGNLGLSGKALPFKEDIQKTYEDDGHICFTIYEQSDGDATLYSSIGFASLYRDSETGVATKPEDDTPNLLKWLGSVIFKQQAPTAFYYLDLNQTAKTSKNESMTMKGLTYFDWDWTYTSIGKQSGGRQSGLTYQNAQPGGDKDFKAITYWVDNYLDVNIEGGAYFVFDVVFENASLNGNSYTNAASKTTTFKDGTFSDNYLPSSGSIFNAIGIMSPEVAEYKNNDGATDWVAVAAKIGTYIILGASIVATGGASAPLSAVILGSSKVIVKKLIMGILISVATMLTCLSFASANAKVNFAQPSYLHYGYLASTYAKDIYYNVDADGNVYLEDKTDSVITNKDGDSYTFVSMDRPLDYYSNQYIGIPISLYANKEDAENNKNNCSVPINNEEYYALLSSTGNEENVYGVPLKQEDVVNGVTTINKIHLGSQVINDCTLLQRDGLIYRVVKKYEYSAGQYYCFAYYGELKRNRVTCRLDTSKISSELYVVNNHNYYVNGTFEKGVYKYNSYPGNNLSYNAGKYYINGIEIDPETATYSNQPQNYIITATNSSNYETITKQLTLGYTWFDKVYFTENGTKNIKYNNAELMKYATYTYKRDVDGDISDLGTKGVDYIVRTYYTEETRNDANGNPTTEKYFKPHEAYFTLSDTPFENDAFVASNLGTNSSGASWNANKTICVPVYPGTFVNPYSSYSTLKNSSTIHDNPDKNYIWQFTTQSGVAFKPTYYIFEGGYHVETDDVKDKIYFRCEDEYKDKTIAISSSDSITDGEVEVKSFKEICSNWGEYKNWYMANFVDNGKRVKLSERYYYANGILYVYNADYVIHNGLLYQEYLSQNIDENINVFAGQYLTNPRVGLYTRYKYSTGDGFETSKWGSYKLVPTGNQTYINSGTTRFSESARVILSSTNALRLSGSGAGGGTYDTQQAGKITIS